MSVTLTQTRFTIPEILSLVGLVQCVYILVYMAFRSGGWRHALVPFAYFFVLGAAFFADFALRVTGGTWFWGAALDWASWVFTLPLGVLLMIQIARIGTPPPWRNLLLLGLVPLAFAGAAGLAYAVNGCGTFAPCDGFDEWLTLCGLLAGLTCLAAMWLQRPLLAQLTAQPGGRDRYWLILALVLANLFFLATMLATLSPGITDAQGAIIRTLWGLCFVYLAGTSLFRIYPQSIRLIERTKPAPRATDHTIAEKIKKLLTLDKVYQESTYTRVSLAKELGISETDVSRIINAHFGKTLPQLFNDLRIGDAMRLLRETNAPIKTVAQEVGFNSTATFNRVFRSATGMNPSQYREQADSAN